MKKRKERGNEEERKYAISKATTQHREKRKGGGGENRRKLSMKKKKKKKKSKRKKKGWSVDDGEMSIWRHYAFAFDHYVHTLPAWLPHFALPPTPRDGYALPVTYADYSACLRVLPHLMTPLWDPAMFVWRFCGGTYLRSTCIPSARGRITTRVGFTACQYDIPHYLPNLRRAPCYPTYAPIVAISPTSHYQPADVFLTVADHPHSSPGRGSASSFIVTTILPFSQHDSPCCYLFLLPLPFPSFMWIRLVCGLLERSPFLPRTIRGVRRAMPRPFPPAWRDCLITQTVGVVTGRSSAIDSLERHCGGWTEICQSISCMAQAAFRPWLPDWRQCALEGIKHIVINISATYHSISAWQRGMKKAHHILGGPVFRPHLPVACLQMPATLPLPATHMPLIHM